MKEHSNLVAASFAVCILGVVGFSSASMQNGSTESSEELVNEIQITQEGDSFYLTCDGAVAREGYHVTLCYLTTSPEKTVLLDCKVTQSAKIKMGLKIDSLLDNTALANTSGVVRFDHFYSSTYGHYQMTNSELMIVDVKKLAAIRDGGK